MIQKSYKTDYANKYFTFISIFFSSAFLILLAATFLLPFYPTLLGGFALLFAYLVYWSFSTNGSFTISSKNNQKQISITGKVELTELIHSVQTGWSYASFNSAQGVNSVVAAYMPLMASDDKTVENTLQRVILIQLENGENIAIVKELLPWQETNFLDYIGHIMDNKEIHHKIYLQGNFRKLSQQIEKMK